MTTKSNPLSVLLSLKQELEFDIDDQLIEACYMLQQDHQYDKERDLIKKMEALIEESVTQNQDGAHI